MAQADVSHATFFKVCSELGPIIGVSWKRVCLQMGRDPWKVSLTAEERQTSTVAASVFCSELANTRDTLNNVLLALAGACKVVLPEPHYMQVRNICWNAATNREQWTI